MQNTEYTSSKMSKPNINEGSYRDHRLSALARADDLKVSIELVRLQSDHLGGINELHVQNGKMHILTAKCVVRVDLNDPLRESRITLPPDLTEVERPAKAWLDPSGEFFVVRIGSGSFHFLHSSYSRFKPLTRLNGLNINFLVFRQTAHATTLDFCAAGDEGDMYMASIKHHDPATQGNKRDDKYVKHVYHANSKICGLFASDDFHTIVLFDEIGRKISWKCDVSTISDLLQIFRHTPVIEKCSESYSVCNVYALSHSQYCFSVSSGQIRTNDSDVVKLEVSESDWNPRRISSSHRSLLATEYHILYITSDKKQLVVLGKLAYKAPLIVPLTPFIGNNLVSGLSSDAEGQTLWLYTPNNVFEIRLSNEPMSIWHSLYKSGNYKLALEMIEVGSRSVEAKYLTQMVRSKEAYELLHKGGLGLLNESISQPDRDNRREYLRKGIESLVFSKEPFEKVALMFLCMAENEIANPSSFRPLLREFLSLEAGLPCYTSNELTSTILTTWIVELTLREMQTIETSMARKTLCHPEYLTARKKPEKHMKDLDTFLFSFLKSQAQSVDRDSISAMMIRMGFDNKLLRLAEVLHDFRIIIDQHVRNKAWANVIQILNEPRLQGCPSFDQLVTSTSRVLLSNIPESAVEFWITLKTFNFESLLPAIVHFNELHKTLSYSRNPTYKFLRRLVYEKNVNSSLINNQYLISLICHQVSADNAIVSRAIIETLGLLRRGKENSRSKPYDSRFLLRACLRFQRIEPAVSILLNDLMKFETALTLALDSGSNYLAEVVLRKYDESSKSSLGSRGSNLIEDEYNPKVAHSDLCATRFDSDGLRVRMNLWNIYALHLIKTASKDKSSEKESDAFDSTGAELKAVGRASPKLDSRLSRSLSYLLDLSRSFGGSGDLFTFKDILPLLPENMIINHVRDSVVSSLHSYNGRINHLGREMQASAATSTNLRNHLLATAWTPQNSKLHAIIEPGEPCRLCNKLLLQNASLIYPNCQHGCHRDCSIRFFLQSKGEYRFKKIFQSLNTSLQASHKEELELFLRKACPLCAGGNLRKLHEELAISENDREWSLPHVTFSRGGT